MKPGTKLYLSPKQLEKSPNNFAGFKLSDIKEIRFLAYDIDGKFIVTVNGKRLGGAYFSWRFSIKKTIQPVKIERNF